MPNRKKQILVTGGAGFVGTNLIKFLIKKTKFNIISLDNYSSGTRKNHIKNSRIKYLKGHTKNISDLLKNPKNIHSLFHSDSRGHSSNHIQYIQLNNSEMFFIQHFCILNLIRNKSSSI